MKLSLIYAIIAACAQCSFAATYYARTDGSDSNTGTTDTAGGAWLTVQKAATTMTAGDTVNVKNGRYPEKVTISAADGSSGSPIKFLAESTNAVIGGFDISRPYIQIVGFTICGTNVGGYNGLVEVQTNANHLVIAGNHFDSPYRAHAVSQYQHLLLMKPSAAADYIFPTNVLVNQNFFGTVEQIAVTLYGRGHRFTSNRMESAFISLSADGDRDAIRFFSSDTLFEGNVITNWSSVGVGAGHPDVFQVFSGSGQIATNNRIQNNLVIDCAGTQIGNLEDQDGLRKIGWWTFATNTFSNVGFVMGIWAHDFSFYNNTFYRCGTNSSAAPFYYGYDVGNGTNGDGGIVKNNIFMECGPDVGVSSSFGHYSVNNVYTNAAVYPSYSSANFNYNLVIGSGAGTTKTTFAIYGREANGINGSDPLFTNAGADDYSLQAGSPALATGFGGVNIGAWQGAGGGGGSTTYRGFSFGSGVRLIGAGRLTQ
jgi:hypothetical protein